MDNLNTDSVLDLAAQTALELIPEASGCVMHFLSGNELLPVTFSADYQVKMVQPSVGIEGIVRQAIESKQVIYLADVTTHLPQFSPDLSDMRTLLVTPLIDNQNAVGALSVYSLEADAFEEGHNHILSILANQAAIAITKARVLREKELAKEREKWAIRNLFQRYVNPTVVERLVDGRESLALGGKRQAVSVLFADIRGFTTFSEHLPPERVVEVLNQYLGLAVRAILAEEGTLDKFMGDAIMAFFNAPLPQPDSTLRAVRAALAMQQAIAVYNATASDHQPLTFGIGIHFDQAVVGNIGTPQQMNYTIIGNTVNLAKRLEESAASGQIILSQAAYRAVKKFVRVEDLGLREFKGHTNKEHVYALVELC
jgi:class 3 adenylate cyclase